MRAIIVGASSGIGFKTAQLLINNGHEVVNISRSKAQGIESIYADASVKGSVGAAIVSACQKPTDALIYSAGYSMASPIEYAQEADYKYLFEVNLFGLMEAVAAITPFLRLSGGGRIVMISSMAASFPIAFDSFYSASKAAVDMFALGASMELERFNIKVTCVKPGGVSTRFSYKRNVYDEERVYEYGLRQRKAVASLNKEEQTGMSAAEVAQIIYSTLFKPSPPLMLACGFKNKTRLFAKRLLPQRSILDMSISKYDQ